MHFLLTNGHLKFFFRGAAQWRNPGGEMCVSFRAWLRLIPIHRCVKFVARFLINQSSLAGLVIRYSSTAVNVDVHRYQESIAGHPYLIEVIPVSEDRWRAYIVRIPGVPTALMPFYGPTPADAARQLRDWLIRAHRQASSPAGTV